MKLLAVIDMQNDFIDGALGTKEAEAIAPAVRARIEECRRDGWEIVFTRDTHTKEYPNTQEGKHLPIVHCVKDTDGWAIREGLAMDGDRGIIEGLGCLKFDLPKTIANGDDVCQIRITRK